MCESLPQLGEEAQLELTAHEEGTVRGLGEGVLLGLDALGLGGVVGLGELVEGLLESDDVAEEMIGVVWKDEESLG